MQKQRNRDKAGRVLCAPLRHRVQWKAMRCAPYIIDGSDPLRHIAVENALLDTMATTGPLLLFYVNSPSVIIGRNQNPWREIAGSSTVPWFRRASGGGAVYHDEGNLNWSFIVPRDAHDQDAELASIARGLSERGASVSPGARGGIFCDPLTVHGGKKISGTARRFGRTSVIHHGTVLVSTDMGRMHACLGGMETIDDRGIASVPASPVNLSDLVPGISVANIMESLSRACTGTEPSPLPSGMVDAARLAKEAELLGSDAWRLGMTPQFSVKIRCGSLTFLVVVKSGLVENATVMANEEERADDSSIQDVAAGFTGKPFSYILVKEIEAAISTPGLIP